jgi:hypothetical protein
MARLIGPLAMAVLCATAVAAVLPRGIESAELLYAQDRPEQLADHAVAKLLSTPRAVAEIEDALAAGDAELALSFLDLARERRIAIEPALARRVEAANGTAAQAANAAKSFAHGFVTGAPDDLAGLAGTATGDLFVFGDIRDAIREGVHVARGEPADELVLGLACAGIAVTAGTFVTLGAGGPARVGLSLVKAARKTGRLAAPVAEWMTRSVREVVDTEALGAALAKASFTTPGVALRAARDAVKVDRAEGLVTMMGDVGRVQSKAGTKAVLDGLTLAEGSQDMARIARVAATKGGKTRAILKLAGRSAFVLTFAAMDLASWVLGALFAVFGFCSAVKRTTERATENYLRWRKARRARAEAAAAAVP